MNNLRRTAPILGVALCVAIVSAIVQLWVLPVILAGADLDVLAGSRHDPHLLTAWLWLPAVRACGASAVCAFGLNAVVFSTFVFVATYLAWNVLSQLTATRRLIVAALFGVLLGTSPFAAAFVGGPLGAETTVVLALVAAALGDAASVWRLSVIAQCVVAAALVLQDMALVPFALTYAILARRPASGFAGFAPSLCVAGAIVARAVLGRPAGVPHPDSLAGPATIVALGVVIFVVLPGLVYALRSGALQRSLGVRSAEIGRLLVLAGLAIAAGAFAITGDSTPALLLGEAALWMLGIVIVRSRAAATTAVFLGLAIVAALQLVGFAAFHNDLPAVVTAQRSALLRNIVAADANSGYITCILADAPSRSYLLVRSLSLASPDSGADVRIVSSLDGCPTKDSETVHLLATKGFVVQDWHATGLNLARVTALSESAPFVFPAADGDVVPRRAVRTPTGLGAFSQRIGVSSGDSVPTFTVVSGFSYRFDCVPVRKGQRLSFAVSEVPNTPAAAYAVTIINGSKRQKLVSGAVPFWPGPDAAWHFVSTSLPVTSSCASFIFSAPIVVNRSAWVTFAGASIT